LQAQVGTTFVYITHDQSEAMVMSDHVAVMKLGQFEQIDTPQNLYYNPGTSFVAQFVGENNKFVGRLKKDPSGTFALVLNDGQTILAGKISNLEPGDSVELFIRPEAMIINPGPELQNINVMEVEVKSILFDGGNSRLLVKGGRAINELIVALPQNNMFDHIRPRDLVRIGWDPAGSVCFKNTGVKTYEEL
jgi:spermidine/putrescine transport system ATP-binding protein